MIVIGIAGYNTYRRDGLGFRLHKLTFRLPEIFQKLSWTAQENEALGKELGDGSCFLNTDQDMLNYKANFNACRPQINSENKPSLILWGDSYAAHLYPGSVVSGNFAKTVI